MVPISCIEVRAFTRGMGCDTPVIVNDESATTLIVVSDRLLPTSLLSVHEYATSVSKTIVTY